MSSLPWGRRSVLSMMGAAVVPAAWAQTGAIVIGQTVPQSGPVAALGKATALGSQVLIDAVNAAGGIGGTRIKLVTLDDGFAPDRTAANARKLIQDEKAIAILNVAGGPNNEILVKENILSAAGVPSIGPFTGSMSVRALKSPFIYFVTAGVDEEANAMVRQAKSMGLTNVGVMYQDDLFGQDGLTEVRRAAKEAGLPISATGAFDRIKQNVEDAVEALGKAQPKAIFMFSASGSTAKFAAAYRRKYGAGTYLIASSAGSVDAIVAAIGKESARGIGLVQTVPNPASATSRIAQEYRKAMEQFGPKDWVPSAHVLQGYVVAKVLVEGLQRSGGRFTPAGLAQGLDRIQNQRMGELNVDYSGGNRQGMRYSNIGIIGLDGRLMN